MPKMQRTSPLSVVACAVVGIAIGLLLQVARSTWGISAFVPPVSLAATLIVIAIVLLALGVALRRAVTRRSERTVNPFHAVRLLAGARAGMFGGALFAGFAAGLLLQLLTRTVPAQLSLWLPALLVLASGVVLVVCGFIVERLCRIPPSESDADDESEDEAAGDLSPDGA